MHDAPGTLHKICGRRCLLPELYWQQVSNVRVLAAHRIRITVTQSLACCAAGKHSRPRGGERERERRARKVAAAAAAAAAGPEGAGGLEAAGGPQLHVFHFTECMD